MLFSCATELLSAVCCLLKALFSGLRSHCTTVGWIRELRTGFFLLFFLYDGCVDCGKLVYHSNEFFNLIYLLRCVSAFSLSASLGVNITKTELFKCLQFQLASTWPLVEPACFSGQVGAVDLDCFFFDIFFYHNEKIPSEILFLRDPYSLVITDTFLATNLSDQHLTRPWNLKSLMPLSLNKCGLIFLTIISA